MIENAVHQCVLPSAFHPLLLSQALLPSHPDLFQHPVRRNVFGYTTRPDTMQSQFSEAKRDHSPHSLARVAFSPISRRDLVANIRLPGAAALYAYAAIADEPPFDP